MRVPKLRFKDFSDDWTKNTIQFFINNKFIISHLDGNHGALYPKNHEFSATGVPYITANDFVTGNVDFRKCKFLPEVKAKKFKKGIAIDGDVLFAHNATVGPCAILRTDLSFVVLSTSATYFRCDLKKINNYFLLYSFQSDFFVSQYRSIMSQTTRNQVPITSQRKLLVALPSLPEQTKIANFLTAIDKKITQLTQKCDLLAQYKKGVIQQIFSQKLRFKDDDGHEFPEWEEKKFVDLEIYISDGNYGEQYPKNEELKQTGVPFIRANNIHRLELTWTDMKFIDFSLHKVLTSGHLEENDILVTTRGDIGMVALVTSEFHGANINAQICLLRITDKNKLNNKYLLQLLSSDYCQKQFKELQTGSALKQLPKKNLFQVKILYPEIKEQTKIANFLTVIDDKITQAQAQLDAVKRYKKGLLQQLFV